MADHWIKVEKGTPDKPEILEMSAILSIDDPDTIVGKLIRVWAWFDSNSENGHAPSVTSVLLDRLTGVTGFVDAMVTVGWLEKSDSGFLVANFDRHLGKGAKKRASDAERKRKSRDKSQQCHNESVTENGPDKIREDKSIKIMSAEQTKCPHGDIVNLYHDILPELPRVKDWTPKRQGYLRTVWNQNKVRQDLNYWEKFFTNYVKNSDFLTGRASDWKADLEWLVKPANFIKIIEKKYENRN